MLKNRLVMSAMAFVMISTSVSLAAPATDPIDMPGDSVVLTPADKSVALGILRTELAKMHEELDHLTSAQNVYDVSHVVSKMSSVSSVVAIGFAVAAQKAKYRENLPFKMNEEMKVAKSNRERAQIAIKYNRIVKRYRMLTMTAAKVFVGSFLVAVASEAVAQAATNKLFVSKQEKLKMTATLDDTQGSVARAQSYYQALEDVRLEEAKVVSAPEPVAVK